MSGNIVILLLDPEGIPGTLFHPGGIGDVNLYRKSIDKLLMLYGKWLSNITSVSDKVVLRLNALLAVGKMPMKGRMFRVALIPVDIRDDLQTLL